jgi:hypothetical protein
LAYRGGSDIIEYDLQWDNGNSSPFASLNKGDVLLFTHTSVTEGTTYRFKYSARNVHGWGNLSPEVAILAASVPAKITPAVTTTMSSANVLFSWTLPSSDNGSAITGYRVTFKKSDGSFITDTNCIESDSNIRDNRLCQVPMTVFTSAPFSLNLNDLIVALVEPKNSIGYGIISDANTGVVEAQTVPQSPALTPTNGSLTSNS